jgi:predicted DNA-binding transcriptional regulator AlpA
MMTPLVETDDLIDAHEVARLAGLTHPSSVSGYLRRYPDMPRPLIDMGTTRPRLWLREEIQEWVRRRGATRRATAGH